MDPNLVENKERSLKKTEWERSLSHLPTQILLDGRWEDRAGQINSFFSPGTSLSCGSCTHPSELLLLFLTA